MSTDTDKHGHTEVIMDLHIKLPRKNHRYLLEVKVNSSAEICVLPLRAYMRMFPNNLTTDGPPILEYDTDSILLVPGTVTLKLAHYRTCKLMPFGFFILETKN